MALLYRAIDIMEWTKDRLNNPKSQAEIDAHIAAIKTDFPTLTHIGISIPMNTQAQATPDFSIDPATYAARFTTPIHSSSNGTTRGVLWRGTDCEFEGIYSSNGFSKQSRRNGNRFTYLATDITDGFSSSSSRNHGYGMSSAAGNLSTNYLTSHQGGNSWTITSNELIGPAADGWRRTCLFNASGLRDVTMVAKVKKVGNQQIVVRASTNSNFPGYGLQMRDTNVLRIERPGLASLGETSKTWVSGDYYWLKLQAVGTTIRGKAWAVTDSEPGAWDISVTDGTYSNGYCGFSGESSSGVFDDMTITPAQDTSSWMYRAASFIDTNHALFATGDIIVPFPEAAGHQSLTNEGSYNQFFIDLKYVIETQMAGHSKTVKAGFFSHLFTAAIQQSYNAQYADAAMTTVDHYGSSLGLNRKLLSWPFDSGVINSQNTAVSSGTTTYTPPISISEAAANRCTIIPDKSAFNQDIEVYIVNKGTGDWTVTVHTQANAGVQMADHTDITNLTDSYQVTIPNAQLVNNAWNVFPKEWVNLVPDTTFHVHVTSTVADGTLRTRAQTANNLEFGLIRQYKCNARPEALEIDFRNLYARTGQKVFEQEWGDYWSTDPGRSNPIRTQTEHEAYLESIYSMFLRLIEDGILEGFQYWRAVGGHEGIYNSAGTTLMYEGVKLQEFFVAADATPAVPDAPASVSVQILSPTSVQVSWTNVGTETGYTLQRASGAVPNWNSAGEFNTSIDETTRTFTDQNPEVIYNYRVKAFNNTGFSSYSPEAQVTMPAEPPPPVVDTPVIAPSAGTHSLSVQVSITDGTAGAAIYYTTNGNDPTASSTPYTGAFTLTQSATVKAIAIKAGLTDSLIASSSFVINFPAALNFKMSRKKKKIILTTASVR